ncbi:IucA/IucC family C-terminal-domain containing protein [Enterovibrio nigricans]|nr:IucA/IucC family C-terminal-domain containing protein [Enterovibrio nigricans]
MLDDIISDIAASDNSSKTRIAIKWFAKYWECAIEPMIRLYDEHGIALEAHQQNSVMRLIGGYPSIYYFRDNQGFYLSKAYQSYLAAMEPESVTVDSLYFDDEIICDRFAYYLMINHLFSIIGRMGADGLVDEGILLSFVQQRLAAMQYSLSGAGKMFVDRLLTRATIPAKANLMTRVHDVDELVAENEQAIYCELPNPLMSTWLHNVIASDKELSNLSLLNEYAGARFQASYMDVETSPEAGQLAVIMRESVASQLKAGESAVPFNALMMIERDGLLFIAGWVEQHGLIAWLDKLIAVVVIPIWHLLVKHGIGIEPHGQNVVLVHKNGWPERILIRDFHESVEYTLSFIGDPSLIPDFTSLEPHLANAPLDDYYAMSSVELLRELVMDTLFIYNLTEVSHLIERFYSMDESAFWQRVSEQLEEYAKVHPELNKRLSALGHTQEYISTESLMTRKLLQSKVECHHLIPNALHR